MLVRWSDFQDAFSMLDDFRVSMDRVEDPPAPGARLQEKDDAFVLTVDLPGMTEKDVEVTLDGDVLTVRGERKVEPPEGYRAHRRERVSRRFARCVSLPSRVDPEKVVATVQRGVLTVTLPRAPETKPRQIAVRSN